MLLTLFQQNLASSSVSASATQTLDSLTQTALVADPVAATASQTLGTITQSAVIAATVAASAAQTLDTIAQAATLEVKDATPVNLGAGGGSWIKTSDDGIIALAAHDVSLPGLRIGTPELAPHPVFKVQSVTLELRVGQPRIVRNDTNEILDLLSLIDLIEQKAA